MSDIIKIVALVLPLVFFIIVPIAVIYLGLRLVRSKRFRTDQDEVATLQRRVAELESRVNDPNGRAPAGEPSAGTDAPRRSA